MSFSKITGNITLRGLAHALVVIIHSNTCTKSSSKIAVQNCLCEPAFIGYVAMCPIASNLFIAFSASTNHKRQAIKCIGFGTDIDFFIL
jgi:hypothetical protein